MLLSSNMKTATALLFCCILAVSSAVQGAESPQKSSTPPGSSSTSDSTSEPTKPSQTTEITSPTTSSTSSPITTASTTTKSPETTTTSTTTIQPPTPAPQPSPDGRWVVNGTNMTCIVAKMDLQLIFEWKNSTTQNSTKKIQIPTTAATTVSGACNENGDSMVLSWKFAETKYDKIIINFAKVENNKYVLQNITIEIVAEEFNHTGGPEKFTHVQPHFNTTIGRSYRCMKVQHLNLINNNNTSTISGSLEVSNLQFQAFKNDKTINFGVAEDCAFDTSDIVPIAVGCVLATLVVIVLVAYLISRRRSQARGYLSM